MSDTFNVGDRVRLVNLDHFSHNEQIILLDRTATVTDTESRYVEVELDEDERPFPRVGSKVLMMDHEITHV